MRANLVLALGLFAIGAIGILVLNGSIFKENWRTLQIDNRTSDELAISIDGHPVSPRIPAKSKRSLDHAVRVGGAVRIEAKSTNLKKVVFSRDYLAEEMPEAEGGLTTISITGK